MTDVIRKIQADSMLSAMQQQKAIVADMNKYFSRREDHDRIREEVKKVFGQRIKTVTDPDTGKSVEMYTNEAFGEQVNSGVVEALAIGFAPKVVNPLASLFTERGQRFTLVAGDEKDTKSAEKLLEENRKKGRFKYNAVSADEYSIRNGSAAILQSFARDTVQYQYLTVDQITPYFSDQIEEDDQLRAVDTSDIEDAYMVLIQLSQVNNTEWNYLAIYGRSDEHENGRHVQFIAADGEFEVPPVGSDNVIEYEIDGVYCNPLSKFANENPEEIVPEYPIIVIYGGTTDSGNVFPVSTSLFDDSLTFDVHASHILGTSSDAARGTNIFERNEEGTGKPLPRQTVGNISTEAGITFKHESLEASASETSFNVLKDQMIHLASGYSVPDFMVVSEDHALEASSGVALQVKARPLKKAREKRVEQNYSSVDKMFTVEKIYIHMFSDAPEADKNLLLETTLIWDPGEFHLPENKKEKAERIVLLKKEGLYDEIDSLRDLHDLATDDEAIELYEKMKARAEKYPPLKQPEHQGQPGQPSARAGRRSFGQLRQQQQQQGDQNNV
jgi:hypothetical protein